VSEVLRRVRRRVARGKAPVLLDACHSGSVVDGERALPPDIEAVREAPPKAGKGASVLTSSSAREMPREDVARKSGAFPDAAPEGPSTLGDGDGDEWISLKEREGYVVRKLREPTGGPRTPRLLAPGEKGGAALFRLPDWRTAWGARRSDRPCSCGLMAGASEGRFQNAQRLEGNVAMSQPIDWRRAVAALSSERERAVAAAGIIRGRGTPVQVDAARLDYADGRAEVGAVIAALLVALEAGSADAPPPELDQRWEIAIAERRRLGFGGAGFVLQMALAAPRFCPLSAISAHAPAGHRMAAMPGPGLGRAEGRGRLAD
jgi:hypothetical protein